VWKYLVANPNSTLLLEQVFFFIKTNEELSQVGTMSYQMIFLFFLSSLFLISLFSNDRTLSFDNYFA
jgi:hypothetical protein